MSEYINTTPHEISWDDEITNDGGSFVLLEEGDYNFTVTAFERARFPGSTKIPACNKAALTLSVDTPEGTASVKYDLILYSSLEWKISEFFRAIGQKKHGENLRPRWGEVVGSKGRAHFKPRSYTDKEGNEKQANDVSKFFDYDPANFTGATDWVQQAQNAAEVPAAPKWQAGKF